MAISEPLLRDRVMPFGSGRLARPAYRKGTRFIFLGHVGDRWQHARARRRRREPRGEFSFLVNSLFPWNRFARR